MARVTTIDRKLFESVFYGDSILIVAKFLGPKAIIMLCRTCTKIKHNLYSVYKHGIMKMIDDWFRAYFKEKYCLFRQAMISDKAVLSGSFIIQMILGERWKNSDIDIFTSVIDFKENRQISYDNTGYKYYTNMEVFLHRDGKLTMEDMMRIMNDKGCDDEDRVYVDALGSKGSPHHGGSLTAIAHIANYYIDTKRDHIFRDFQIIELYRDTDVLGFIDSTFDFDICKNTFYYDEQGMYLNIRNVNDIINRKAGFKPCANLESSLIRCRKYTARGFKFFDDTDSAIHYHAEARKAFMNIGDPCRKCQYCETVERVMAQCICREVWYCNDKCSEADWIKHRNTGFHSVDGLLL